VGVERRLFRRDPLAISIFLVPRLGTATFVAVLVAGQMLASLAFRRGAARRRGSAGPDLRQRYATACATTWAMSVS
jgi:hypothetical protein